MAACKLHSTALGILPFRNGSCCFPRGREIGHWFWKDFLRKSGIHLCLVFPLDLSTLDSICDSLSGAFRGISHCPPSGLYAHLCRLLAPVPGPPGSLCHRLPYHRVCLHHLSPPAAHPPPQAAQVSAPSLRLVLGQTGGGSRLEGGEGPHPPLLAPSSKAPRSARGSNGHSRPVAGLHLQEKPGDIPLARIQRLFSFRPLGSGHFPQPEKDSASGASCSDSQWYGGRHRWLCCSLMHLSS